MTREQITNECLAAIDSSKCLLTLLSTGVGKTKITIDCINKICDKVFSIENDRTDVLIVVDKKVHIQNWKDEFEKWGGINTDNVEFCCYASLHKYANSYWDVVVLDECFKGSTEILTDKGYKRFDCLEGTEKVAQFTDNGSIEFVNPIRFIKKDYKGKICKMHLGRNRYVYLTPNHNQVYRTKAIKEWRLRPIKDIKENDITRIPVSGKGTGDNSLLSPLEQLFIAIQADGTLQRHQKNESVYSIQVTKDRKKQRLRTILNNIDSSLWTSIKGREGIDRYLIKLPKGNAKLLSTHFNIEMGYDRANSFIDEIIEWDGYKSSYKYYSSIIKENVDFVSSVAVQAGYKSLVSIEQDNRKDSYRDVYRVFMRKQEDIDTQSMHKEYLDYNDKVYCVEVPSSKIVVRSEGYSFISGNCHHVGSEVRLEALESINIAYNLIGLSATVPRELKAWFKRKYKTSIVSCTTQEAIESNILPDPTIYLMPLTLNNKEYTELYEINKKDKSTPIHGDYKDLWVLKRSKKHAFIRCTQRQYLNELDGLVNFYKRKAAGGSTIMKNLWLRACGDRLTYLANAKNEQVQAILTKLKNYRTITFCTSIEQSEKLGKNCIHSKNKTAQETLNTFNVGKIKHITACHMLNESINLTNCRYGIFANINASETIQIQRVGKL